jgi:outer membrane protein W
MKKAFLPHSAQSRLQRPAPFHLDVKYVQIRSDETAITKVKVDPFIYGIGVGYPF